MGFGGIMRSWMRTSGVMIGSMDEEMGGEIDCMM